MQYMSSVDFISLIFHILIGINLANALLRCYDTGNFTTNSTYAKNRDLIISSLASNITANGGFLTTTVGQGTDKVYGMMLCRADTSSEHCSKCINTITKSIIENCPNQKESMAWLGDPPCHIHYANHYFLGQLELSPSDAGYNTGNISSNINMEEFDQIWSNLMESLATRASMGTSKVKYASGEAKLTPFQTIYALMQCTPDISKTDCDHCLRQTAGSFINCCHGKQGGYITMPSCIFRWDLYPFYNSIAETPPPTPTPTPPPLSISPPSIRTENGNFAARTVVIIVVPTIVLIALIALICALFHYRKPKQDTKNLDENSSEGSLQFNYNIIRLATNDFSDNNKLGQGGFGSVYKGVLPNGQMVAIKRLSRSSNQGEVQFINEVKLVARLQHRNLVRLLGFCFQGNERLLIYEFVPNSSLDHFIFDEGKRLHMDWKTRYKIIVGIARGILYLHEDSQLRIIHRDLKLSNILLDEHMNPKISDFGTAKLFATDQSQDTTTNVMGTYGYMAPEYAMHGVVSVKSDVFSFGVLVLEIINGQKISDFKNGEEEGNLLNYAWENWNQGTASNIIDPILMEVSWRSEILRCINIGLLCLQEDAMKRPNMASVVLMLDSYSVVVTTPSRPAYHVYSYMEQQSSLPSTPNNSESTLPNHSEISPVQNSINEATITELEPR